MTAYTQIIRACLVCLAVSLGSLSVNAQGDSVAQELLQRLDAAKTQLEATQTRIDREKRQLSEQLTRQREKTRALENEARNLQKNADQALVSLDKLRERLDKWKDQAQYQDSLSRHFRERVFTDGDGGNNENRSSALMAYPPRLEARLKPHWKRAPLTTASGNTVNADILDLGLQYYYLTDTGAGFAERAGEHYQRLHSFASAEAIRRLRQTGSAVVPVDPTQGRAVTMMASRETIFEHLQKGGLWILPILAFGALSLAIALFKLVQLYKLPTLTEKTKKNIDSLLQDGSERSLDLLQTMAKESKNVYYELLHIVLKNPASTARDDLLINRIHRERRFCEKLLTVLTVTAAVAPLLGLLGTVSGMIKTFKMLSVFGSGDPVAVSGGISEALVTTELGLIVAIPALVLGALLNRKVKSHIHEVEETAIALNARAAT